ncbi:hypothetical protein KC354_g8171 [Hortaea werneckii]|nr:hypothetical protein KC354_g8171 [Hortaea werneckii]
MSDISSRVDDIMVTVDSDYQMSESETDSTSDIAEADEDAMDVDDYTREVSTETQVATAMPEQETFEFDPAPSSAAAEFDQTTTMRRSNGISVQLQRTTGPQTRCTVDGLAGPTVLLNGPAVPIRPNPALNEDDSPGLDVGGYLVTEAAGQRFRAFVNIEERFLLRGRHGVLIGVMVGHRRQANDSLRDVNYFTIWQRDDGTIHGEYHIAAFTNITTSERGRDFSINWFMMPNQTDGRGRIRPEEDEFRLGGSWTAPFGTIAITIVRIDPTLTFPRNSDVNDRDSRAQYNRMIQSRGRPMPTSSTWVRPWGQLHEFSILNTRRDAQSRVPEASGPANAGPSHQRVLRRRAALEPPTGDTRDAAAGSDHDLERQFANATTRLTEAQAALERTNRELRPDRPVDDAVMERRLRYVQSIARLSVQHRVLQGRLLNMRGANLPAQATRRELYEDLTDRMKFREAGIQLQNHRAATEGRPLTPDETRRNAANRDEFLNCQQQREDVRRLLS